jgi:phosphate transport system substrate-binding protein
MEGKMSKKRIRSIIKTLIISIIGVSITACSNKVENQTGAAKNAAIVTVSGSTSVGPLMEKEAKAFMDKNKNINIEIQQIGSSAGIKNAIDGISQIGMSSRDLKDAEKASVKDEIICYDGIGIIVHPTNLTSDLTKDQVKDIYTGKITNWKEVGGKDAPIVVVSREEGSGTRDAFQEIIGYKSEELIRSALISQGNGAVKTIVSTNENTIGFVSFEVLMKDEKIDPIIKALKVGGVEPTPENVIAKTYMVSRSFLVVYQKAKLSEEGKTFLEFIKSEQGQKIAKESGAIPLK